MTEELGLHLTIPGVFCLFLFRTLRSYLVALDFSVFIRAKSVDRRLIGRIKMMKDGKTRLCTARWDPCDAELPNAQPQLPTASCMVGVLNVM